MDNDSSLVRARHLEALAQAAKDYTLAELADITLSGGASYSLPTASTTVKGGVKIGTGLAMNGDTLAVNISSLSSNVLTLANDGLLVDLDNSQGGSIDGFVATLTSIFGN